ncbi:uncharacterized protein BT62DRAFT_948930 [Guyanagaster necrorhizus]|uniref:Oxysterol-binding protein n=1 Tax=Guyanagaster necrorhizus TaxID=856835 RepID=A0A9P8ATJ2_9AGAR|nr:uncharacterized protein BT62DRAFT_948930 [Guyanagaster necrorhizus MCA 3950]KAG7447051.1 hypothetical protein BT62DRAFT_948930 [Guyanagaster necrorhizus MCA 3950]
MSTISNKRPAMPLLDEEDDPAVSVPDTGDAGEGGKLKMIVQLVKKCFGVKDIATMRLSLPASLLEPIPNLEWSQYLDRPDFFAAINDSEDPFERMLAVLRFTFTKDLKYVSGRVFKPYNSVLGEHFRAHWDVFPIVSSGHPDRPPIVLTEPPTTGSLETSSIKSRRSSKSSTSKSPSTSLNAHMSSLSLGGQDKLRIAYVTEQVSHHPPVSAYYASCPDRSLELLGVDQISAKVSAAMTVKVVPGSYNKGMFVKIRGGHGEGEQYQVTHPVASVNGLLRGSFYVTVADTTIITCTGGKHGPKFRAIIEYKEESWLGKARFRLEGIIHLVNEGDKVDGWKMAKDVPQSLVVAVFDGSWRGHIRWRRVGSGSYPTTTSSASSSPSPVHMSLPRSNATSRADLATVSEGEYSTLIDIGELEVIPKQVRPLERQLPHESRRLWHNVTRRLENKEYSDATKEKVAIEQRQREEAAERRKKGIGYVPRYFDKDIDSGVPLLTAEGRKALNEELREPSQYHIVGSADAKLSS